MPQPKKKATESVREKGRGRGTGIIIAAVVIVLMLVLVGGGYYQYYVAPFQRTIITVDNTNIRMDYFIKRAKLEGSQPMAMLEILTRELIVKNEAPRYGITVSTEDIIEELRGAARGDRETISEMEFQAWYRQQLNESRLSDADFKEIVAAYLLTARFQEYLAERVATVAEHVHLYGMLLESYEKAQKVRERWEKGEDFSALARENSLDKGSQERGGELGWIPRGALEPGINDLVFSLEPGEASLPAPVEPVPTEQMQYYLFLVKEKDPAREVEPTFFEVLKARALENWLLEELKYHVVNYNFNSEINAWISWQLSKEQGGAGK